MTVTNPRKVVVTDGWKKLVASQNQLEMSVDQEKILQFDVKRAGPGILVINSLLAKLCMLQSVGAIQKKQTIRSIGGVLISPVGR